MAPAVCFFSGMASLLVHSLIQHFILQHPLPPQDFRTQSSGIISSITCELRVVISLKLSRPFCSLADTHVHTCIDTHTHSWTLVPGNAHQVIRHISISSGRPITATDAGYKSPRVQRSQCIQISPVLIH